MPDKNFNAGIGVLLFFVLLFIFSKWGPSIPFSVLSQSKGEPMTVTGEGKSTAIPDIAKVSVGIEISGTSLTQAQNEANNKSKNLVTALKDLGIDEKDIKTSSYNIYPESDYQANPPRITGYRVSTNYIVTVRKIDKINEIMVKVTDSGANLVGGVSFDLSDDAKEKAYDEARKDAIENAKRTANSLSKASGITLGKIINVTESQSYDGIRYALPMAGGGEMDSKAVTPDIQPGTTEINLTVSLSYEIR